MSADWKDQEEPWPNRFEWLLWNRHKGNQSSLAKALGVVPTQVANLLAGAVPGGETLREAVRSHPDINPDWLLTGRGPRERPPPPDAAQRAIQDIEARIARVREEQARFSVAPEDVLEDLAAAERVEPRKRPAPTKRSKRGRRTADGSA